ncbi:hypothetical protein PRIPAC_81436 [Pristionchus pacificus]|uniref:Uncharacterized protein n=1 Tax=Pristionchus pacificus TaxID=54126 RepID=A0A2A6C2J3_PRIPA|nr:hypothetical protein PRIPAC_81436 [Pristionchus pacificus]|eukprot:PDM72329.1 hypothetical protein PRIPAC_38763 [Pristionchus pacificus]
MHVGGIMVATVAIYVFVQNEDLSSLFGQLFTLVHTFFPWIPAPVIIEIVQEQDKVTDQYFNDLIGSWENRIVARK